MKGFENKNGVTLLEMLIVVGIIAILAAMVVGIATSTIDKTKEKVLQATFMQLESALQEYHDYTGEFPVSAPVLPDSGWNSEVLYIALDSKPGSRKMLKKIQDSLIQGPPIEDEYSSGHPGPGPMGTNPKIYDPWGTVLDYGYTQGDSFPTIISAGPDKNFNTTADNIISKKQ